MAAFSNFVPHPNCMVVQKIHVSIIAGVASGREYHARRLSAAAEFCKSRIILLKLAVRIASVTT